MAAAVDYSGLVSELRGVFDSGKTKDLAWRRQQLSQLQKMFEESHESITEAVVADFGGSKLRGIVEFATHGSATHALERLDQWTAPEEVPTPLLVSPTFLAKSYVRPEPKGVVLIIGAWNFPFDLSMHPLVGAIAAGNCVVVKPSESSRNSAALVAHLLGKYLDGSCIRVVQGAAPETTALLREPWDHILYTGGSQNGRIVLQAAAEHLTPVTLELGGKSPAIVDKSAKMKSVVERVLAAKLMNIGQLCVTVDYVLVHKDREQEFVESMVSALESSFGKDPKQSGDFGRMVSPQHVRRITGLLEKTQGRVITGGVSLMDPDARYVPPTLVQGAQIGEPLLTEEIFGPVLPIVSVESMEDAVRKVKAICEKPLALYVFSEDKAATQTVLDNTMSGTVGINTCVEQVVNEHLPFGGVGTSGYGSYHGKAGFDTFTHRRACLHQDTLLHRGATMPLPPNKSDLLYDLIVKFQMTGFLTPQQRRMAKGGLGAAAAAAVGGLIMRSRL